MPFGFKLFKKPWDRVPCEFVLQEYGLGGEKGWSDITEAAGTLPTKDMARDQFKPGHHYRLLARYVEGETAGQIAGVVWNFYEPAPGGLKPKETIKREKPEGAKRADPVAVMGAYADEVERTLAPLGKILESLDQIRARLGGPQTAVASEGEEGMEIPPPEFEGKIPVLFHPYVVHTIAEEMKSVIDYAGKRFEGILGKEGEVPKKEEEEEPLLPSIKKYAKPPEAKAEEEEEKEVEEEAKEEAEEEEPSLPMPPSAPKPEEKPSTQMPSLLEEEEKEPSTEPMVKAAEAEAPEEKATKKRRTRK